MGSCEAPPPTSVAPTSAAAEGASLERPPGARRAPPHGHKTHPMRNPFINDETIDLEIIGVTIAVP